MNEENIDELSSLSEYDVVITILEWESDDKKIEAMKKYITAPYYQKDIIVSLSSTEKKVKLLKELRISSFYINDILNSMIFENDEQRIKAARLLEDDDAIIYEIIKKIEDDKKKLEAISLLVSNYYKTKLVCSFKSDEYKIKALKKYIDNKDDQIRIIKSLSTNKSKLENLYFLDIDGKKAILRSLVFDNDEEIIRVASSLEDEELAYTIVIKIEDDEKKIEALKIFKDEENRAYIIKTIKDDLKKIEQLEKISNEHNKAVIISSLSNDEIMLEQLEKIKKEENKVEIITSLESDELKIKQLDNIVEDDNKANIICSFSKDENKILYIDKFRQEDIKVKIISSINDPILIADLLDKVSDDYNKADIIISMASNADFKIKQIEKLDDEFAKAIVIKSLYDDRIKIQQLSSISNDYCKMAIIESLKNRNEKIKLVETLNDKFLKELLIEVLNSEQYDEKMGFPCLKRTNLKEKFLDKNRKYTEIGLDKKMTIGMEIESEGPLNSIMLALKNIAISEKKGGIRGWQTKDDGSLSNGVEIVSPILSDSKEDIEDIYMICSMLKNGQRASERCGGHIHIGADYLTSKEAYINLFEIWGNTEKIIYQMCNENGEIPRSGIQEYAPPISPKLNEALENGTINIENEDELDEFIEQIQNIQGERYSGLNLLNINNVKNTIEFRIPNGTINPDVWIENARLFGRIVQMSQRLAVIEKQTEISKEDEHLIELFDTLKQDIPEEQKMEILLELLFTEEERQVYRERYNKCAKRLKEMPDEENPLNKSKFSSVNFKKKHSKDEFRDVAAKSRSSSENEVVNETKSGIRGESDINKNKENTED